MAAPLPGGEEPTQRIPEWLQVDAAARPVVVASKCLGFAACRYNGDIIKDPFIQRLRAAVEFIPVCPEMEIGLGVPRDSIRVVSVNGLLQLVQPATGREFSEPMRAFCRRFLAGVGEVDGFVLKSRSPSCGTRDVKMYNEEGNLLSAAKRQGFFGAAAVERFPLLPVEDEGRLKNFLIRERFLTMLFAMARFRELARQPSMAGLVDFHARHKLLLLAYSEQTLRKLGRITANSERRSVASVFRSYGEALPRVFASPAKYTAGINVLMHALGYFRDGLVSDEKAFFLDTLGRFQTNKVPLSVPVGIIRSWIVRFGQPYLAQQYFFHPFPEELLEITDSGKGRNA